MIHVIQQSSLEKITATSKQFKPEYARASALSGEIFAYQIALFSDNPKGERVRIKVFCPCRERIYEVKQVAVTWPHCSNDQNQRFLLDEPGILPDALIELERCPTLLITDKITVLWIEVCLYSPGEQHVDFYIDEELRSRFTLDVLPHSLEKSTFDHCEYIDPCSIAKYYDVPLFSSEHWRILGEYFSIAAKHGVTRILTPLYQPFYGDLPMGGEHVQLFDLSINDNEYNFNFDLLDSWIYIAQKNGIEKFIFPPVIPSLETLKCPEIHVKRDYIERDLFDEEDDVLSADFSYYFRTLLRELIRHLKDLHILDKVSIQFAHAPEVKHQKVYKECRDLFIGIPWGNQIIDTLSPPEFLNLQIGSVPFCSSAKIEQYFNYAFNRYIYLDVFDEKSIINTLIAAPSSAIRHFGVLSFRHNICAMFNLWFNNFCTTQGKKANPLMDNTNENSFPSGAGFLVYPGPNGPIPSIRLKQLQFAIQDKCVLQKLSQLIPFERIYSRIDKKYKFNIDVPAITSEAFLTFREEIYGLFDK